jgi:hypothetical protein
MHANYRKLAQYLFAFIIITQVVSFLTKCWFSNKKEVLFLMCCKIFIWFDWTFHLMWWRLQGNLNDLVDFHFQKEFCIVKANDKKICRIVLKTKYIKHWKIPSIRGFRSHAQWHQSLATHCSLICFSEPTEMFFPCLLS